MPARKKAAKELEFGRGSEIEAYKPLASLPGEEKLLRDLEKYRQMALDLGASEAIIFPAKEFPQDIRVWWKCHIPRCTASGANPHCPPIWHTPWEDAKKIRNGYKYCIIFKTERAPEWWTGRQMLTDESNAALAGYLPPEEREKAVRALDKRLKLLRDYKKLPLSERSTGAASIGPRIAERARLDGHQFAVTFGIGSCQLQRCAKFGSVCVAKTTGICRYPLKVSPEGSAAMYQDFVTLSARLGWDTYVAGHCIQPEDAQDTHYFMAGTVFIE